MSRTASESFTKKVFIDTVVTFEYELEDCKFKYWEMLVYLLANVKSDLVTCSQDMIDIYSHS